MKRFADRHFEQIYEFIQTDFSDSVGCAWSDGLPANGADDALDVRPLPGGSRRTQHLFDAHVLNLPGEVVAKDSIPVSQQIARRRVPGEGIAKLLGRPFRG